MRRVIVPALLAIAMVAGSSADANAFGLFSKLCNSGCDAGCDVGYAVEPACGCEAPCAPTCGFEVAAPCGCDSGCAPARHGLLSKLFGRHHGCGCDSGCAVEPACGCEIAAPYGGYAVEPACGCEIAAPCGCDSGCDSGCGAPKRGLLSRLFGKHGHHHGCASAPNCGCEPSCGCGF